MNESYEILLLAEFSAAHQLRMHDGSLEPLHGHNWRTEVYLTGDRLDAAGLLADFTVLQPQLNDITRKLHNSHLNDLPVFAGRNPSTELIARHIHDEFAPKLPPSVRITRVRVWETSHCAAAYIPR
jgi:6-pyruvoyltetrahydropterin/6-carboxytetrahydropterin synthase